MNGARTTFMRRGYLLTALAAVVLLAASAGTASAQSPSIGFVGSAGTVAENASTSPSTPAPLRVTLSVSNLPDDNPATTANERTDALGTVAVAMVPAGGLTVGGLPAGVTVADVSEAFAASDTATFTVVPAAQDTNWKNEVVSLTLTADGGPPPVTLTGNVFAVTVDDDEVAPVAQFSRSGSVMVHEGNRVDVNMEVVEGAMRAGVSQGAGGIADFSNTGDVFRFTVDPPSAAGATCTPAAGTPTPLVAITGPTQGAPPNAHVFTSTGNLATIGADPAAPESVMIEACANVAQFSGATVTLAVELMLDHTPGPNNDPVETVGPITAGAPLMLEIQSTKAAPTVSFSPTDITIAEGSSGSAVLLSEGEQASEVNMVKLSVEGDAMVGLYHGDMMLEEMDGYVMVDLAGTNAARLMAKSMSDPDLMDGEMKSKTWKIMEADGAEVGDDYWLTVTVEGSTAVPALPLVGQLLLALFLMAGGSRLYRRQRG